MKINLICIGQQMPTWIQTGYQEYCKRMPKACQLVLHELPMPKRTKNIIAPKLKQQEAKLIQKAIRNCEDAGQFESQDRLHKRKTYDFRVEGSSCCSQ